MVIGLEFHSDFVREDPQIIVSAAHHNVLYLLRHHTDRTRGHRGAMRRPVCRVPLCRTVRCCVPLRLTVQ